MSKARIIQADYANWRPVAGRKVLQLVFEVPIEQTEQVLTMLGVPMPGESKWCAIALLESGGPANESGAGILRQTPKPSGATDAATIQIGGTPSPTTVITAAAGTSEIRNKDRKPFASLPLSQQAAIRCQDQTFVDFINEKHGPISAVNDIASRVRLVCLVTSRAELDDDVNRLDARFRWRRLEEQYQSWLTDRQYAEARRG